MPRPGAGRPLPGRPLHQRPGFLHDARHGRGQLRPAPTGSTGLAGRDTHRARSPVRVDPARSADRAVAPEPVVEVRGFRERPARGEVDLLWWRGDRGETRSWSWPTWPRSSGLVVSGGRPSANDSPRSRPSRTARTSRGPSGRRTTWLPPRTSRGRSSSPAPRALAAVRLPAGPRVGGLGNPGAGRREPAGGPGSPRPWLARLDPALVWTG